MRSFLPFILCSLLLVPLLTIETLACACCAEFGHRSLVRADLSDQDIALLKDIRFARNPELFFTVAGFEDIKGLDAIRKAGDEGVEVFDPGYFSVRNTIAARILELGFRTKDGKTGGLRLPIPGTLESFSVDINDGRRGGAGGPLLYKELRLSGMVERGTGFLGLRSGAETKYSLVFQGRGNLCSNAANFTNWILDINGPDAEYRFIGRLASANPGYVFDKERDGAGNRTGDGTNGAAPGFEQYGAKVWSGSPRRVNLGSHRQAGMFRTRLREARRRGVNFAGHFILTYWGCGTGCVMGAIIDAKTGRVYFPKQFQGIGFALGSEPVADEPLLYRKDSRLFILTGQGADAKTAGVSYLLWEGGRFRLLRFDPIGDD